MRCILLPAGCRRARQQIADDRMESRERVVLRFPSVQECTQCSDQSQSSSSPKQGFQLHRPKRTDSRSRGVAGADTNSSDPAPISALDALGELVCPRQTAKNFGNRPAFRYKHSSPSEDLPISRLKQNTKSAEWAHARKQYGASRHIRCSNCSHLIMDSDEGLGDFCGFSDKKKDQVKRTPISAL